ncbi:hypothetical protein J2T12_000310 [Paenibacillus anaericanus]|uniref:Uncharacterized protein n=1 Tax=Paenibacillus anaericanus TaxID=170367 RepID=A0A433Y8T1_9BACL|nr:FlxA-like family protein [Paenibacillus anaericanus]MDQ0086916.1 hypothetical protein [Paenibacillus anaericanus]RUT46219.1 hypothetical protein EJP82_13965 [Paenibacillus anaericanus]
MNISSSTSGQVSNSAAGTRDIDSQIKQLQKRKTALVKEVSEVVSSGKLDKAAQDKLDALSQQIALIDMQITALMTKKTQIEIEKQKNDANALQHKEETSVLNKIDIKI